MPQVPLAKASRVVRDGNPDWLNDPRLKVVYRPRKTLTAPSGHKATETRGRIWSFRIDLPDGGFIVFDATDTQKALVWDVIEKIEQKVEFLTSILRQLESGDEEPNPEEAKPQPTVNRNATRHAPPNKLPAHEARRIQRLFEVGNTKTEIHRLTGFSRTTIDRVLRAAEGGAE